MRNYSTKSGYGDYQDSKHSIADIECKVRSYYENYKIIFREVNFLK